VFDSSIYDNDAEIVDAAEFDATAPGISGTGCLFTPSNCNDGDDFLRINTPNLNLLSFQNTSTADVPFSISAFIKPDAINPYTIIGKGSNPSSGREWLLTLWSPNYLIGQLYRDSDSPATGRYADTSGWTAGEWIHVAMTYNGNLTGDGINVYVDGVESDIGYWGGTSYPGQIAGSEPVLIGATNQHAGGSWECFEGTMDEIKVWRRELTAGEVLDECNEFMPGGC